MLKSCLMTHSRYQGEVFFLNFGVERFIRNQFSNLRAMSALAPHVADIHQRVTAVHDTRKLEPRLDRSALAVAVDIKQQAVQPPFGGQIIPNPPGLVGVDSVQILTDKFRGRIDIDPATLHVRDLCPFGSMPQDPIESP
eukprot:GHVR01000197.1.p2 GENE.GHVR01000197.1~~GHVR01000197.1.p2  ORF type:complete len:139 (+),score=16.16 GHVR01000197.1:454-870(+)